MESLKRRILALEHQTELGDDYQSLDNVVHRLGQMEDTLEKHQEETHTDSKSIYKHISAAWHLVEVLQQRLAEFEETQRIQSEQLRRTGKELEDLRNRNLELLEADEVLEERLEKLEHAETVASPALEYTPQTCGRDARLAQGSNGSAVRRRHFSSRHPDCPLLATISRRLAQTESSNTSVIEELACTGSWTIRISLLPSRKQLAPLEKDSNAYKRCLSRGLQKIVAIEACDAGSFSSAVTRAFGGVLGNRPWEPMQVRLHENRKREGRPTLRPLGQELAQSHLDAMFIRQYCAVRDAYGRPESMYLAASGRGLSWRAIKRLPVYVEGLESSWEYDRHLDSSDAEDADSSDDEDADSSDDEDANSSDEGQRHQFSRSGQTSRFHSPSPRCLKRDMGEMQAGTLSNSLRLKGDTDSRRTKIVRTCMPELIEVRREMKAAR